jgi:hypothetical protein
MTPEKIQDNANKRFLDYAIATFEMTKYVR